MKNVLWDVEATKIAEYVVSHMYEAHRGAMPTEYIGVVAIFGNDGAPNDDPRVKREVELVRQELRQRDIGVLGFGIDPEDCTWVILVEDDVLPLEEFNCMPWRAWDKIHDDPSDGGIGRAFCGIRMAIAEGVIAKHSPTPALSLV